MDVTKQKSERSGFSGFLENLLRQFQVIAHLVLITPLYALGSASIGLAFLPGFYFFKTASSLSATWHPVLQYWALGSSLAMGYFAYGFSLLFLVPALNFLFRTKLMAWRGPYYSLPAIRWYIHNALTYLVRFTFLEFVTPTPFNLLFYRLMGMKIGDGTVINTSHISDPSLIEMGRQVTLGGSVTIVAHYGQGGYLVLAPVKIGDKATIGLRAIVMGGVQVGEGAKIMPGSVLLPKTVVPPGETWGGVPAQAIDIRELKSQKAS